MPSYFGIPAYEGPQARKIRKLVEENPKRGKSAKRFALYRNGMTIDEYIKACDLLGESHLAVFDISWDTDPKRNLTELYN